MKTAKTLRFSLLGMVIFISFMGIPVKSLAQTTPVALQSILFSVPEGLIGAGFRFLVKTTKGELIYNDEISSEPKPFWYIDAKKPDSKQFYEITIQYKWYDDNGNYHSTSTVLGVVSVWDIKQMTNGQFYVNADGTWGWYY